MTRPFRLRRSELATPGTSEKMMTKAADSDADVVVLDLEDAVAPGGKEGARTLVTDALSGLDWAGTARAVRVNGVHTEWCHDDVIAVLTAAGADLDLVVVPKVRAPRDVWFVESLLDQLEQKLALPPGRIGLEILIEETEALARVEEIAACSRRIEALILGLGDLAASQGIRVASLRAVADRYPGDMWHFARNRMTVAARAAGVDAVDGTNADYRNLGGYRRDALWAASLGMVGKWAIHPSQIPIANEAFAPTIDEVVQARAVVDAVKAAEAAGQGAASLDGVMIDAATARIFETVLVRADAAASRSR